MAYPTHTQTMTDAAQASAPAIQKHAAPSTCCGGPAPTGTDACCVEDAEAKSAGSAGCGCGSAARVVAAATTTGCCG